MGKKNIVHRDIKMENILLTPSLTLKLADFGHAACHNVDSLSSYRGTVSYMAPEIGQGEYSGRAADVFSAGVALFIIVHGILPFQKASKDDYFYGMVARGEYEQYFEKVKGEGLSADFKDLIMKMLAPVGKDRPSLEEVQRHRWLTSKSYDEEKTRNILIEKMKSFQVNHEGVNIK